MTRLSPIWISHRGLHAHATENSLAAFQAALSAGFDGLETDLRTTKDGCIFLCHDPTLTRVTGHDIAVGQSQARDLATVRLNDGQPLLTLEQFLDAFPATIWTFDVKPEEAPATIAALARLCERPGVRQRLRDQARFLFWRDAHRRAFCHEFPEMALVAMERECYRAGLSVLCQVPSLGKITPGFTYALPPEFAGIPLYRKAWVRRYQERGARVVAYLPRTPDEFAAAIRAGVDEILSDGYIAKT